MLIVVPSCAAETSRQNPFRIILFEACNIENTRQRPGGGAGIYFFEKQAMQ